MKAGLRQTLGTSACPPYHVALVIGGTSAACLNLAANGEVKSVLQGVRL